MQVYEQRLKNVSFHPIIESNLWKGGDFCQCESQQR